MNPADRIFKGKCVDDQPAGYIHATDYECTYMEAYKDVEEQLQAARRFYNANVTNYNNRVTTFPSALVAKAMKAKTRKYFAAEEDVKANVKVEL